MDIDDAFAPIDSAGVVSTDVADALEFVPMAPLSGVDKDAISHPQHGKPSHVWLYHSAGGQLEGCMCRFETRGGKEFRPYRCGTLTKNGQARTGWHWKGWGDGRPLYNLCDMLARREARVIVAEGEKKADAAAQLFPDCVSVSPMNGARSPQKTDWSSVAGRRVVVWPDNDQPGRDFADTTAKLARAAGAADVAIVQVPQEWPEKWDLADNPPAGVDIGTLKSLLDAAQQGPPKGPASEAEINAAAQHLAGLSLIQRTIERTDTAKRLGIPVTALDQIVKYTHANTEDGKPGQGRPIEIPEPEPWPEPVDGDTLLKDLAEAIRSYVVLSTHQADAVALWVVFTHAFQAFDFSPKLVVSSPEPRSGKTRLVEVIALLVRRPLFVSGISPAALLRVIERHAPAMLLDEIDTLMHGDAEMAEALRGLINSGFNRSGARIIKNVPSPEGGYEPRAFSTWCPMLLAGIGKLPDTIRDRSITIAMARKRPNEAVKRLRERDGAELRDLCRKAARWTADNLGALKDADPSAPEQLHDRAADAWSPLFAIAGCAGGEWPERARKAAIELMGTGDDTASARETLLADLREMFNAEKSGVLLTSEILSDLHGREDRPWSEWKAGKPITPRQLAALLKPLGVKANQSVRRGDKIAKGYHAEWFADAFARYAPLYRLHRLQPAETLAFLRILSVTMNLVCYRL